MENFEKKHNRVLAYLIILYSVFAIGISILGVKYYYGQKQKLKQDFEKQLITISDLKVGEILQWREERLQDAKTFYKNTSLAGHIKDYFGNKEATSKEKIETWLVKVQNTKDVETVFLLDTHMKKILAVPDNSENSNAFISPSNYDSIKSGKIVFEDFLRCKETQKIYLKIFVPIFDVKDTSRFIGAVVIRIDPYVYLYSLINRWPVLNKTAETLILKREGDEIVYLNELKFQQNSALNLRFPITQKDLPAVKAALGETGIVEGTDYKGNEVIADVRPIPNSPWFMVTRMDKSEIFAPMKEIFWYIVFTIAGILFMVGLILFIFWREERNRFYQERYQDILKIQTLERRQELILATVPEIVMEVDLNKIYVWSNKSGKEFFGDDVVGKEVADFFVSEQETFKMVQPLFEGSEEIIYVESWQRRKDGKKRLLGWWCKALKDTEGNVTGSLSTARDITEQKQVEEIIRESEEKFRLVFDNSIIGKSVTGLDGSLQMNKAFCDILGYTKEELQNIKWMDLTHPEDIQENKDYVTSILKGEMNSIRWEKRFLHKNGSIVWTDINTTLQRDKDGKPLYFITGVLDITKRKKAEEEVIKLNRIYKVLSNVNQMIVRIKDVDVMFKDACNIAIQDGEFRMAWIGAVNKETNKVDVVASDGVTQDYLKNINIDLNDNVRNQDPTGITIKTGKHFISNDIENDERMIPWREGAKRLGYKSSASFPIKVFGEVLYNLTLYSDELNFFDEDEIALLDELVMDMSFALEFVEREKARKKNERVLEEIISKNPMSIQIVDKKGYTLSTNSAHTKLFGITPPPDYSIFNDTQLEKQGFKDLFERVKKGEVVHFPDSYFNVHDVNPEFPDNPVWVRGVVFPLMDSNGNPERFVLMQDNITEQKKAEEAIRESERNYRDLIDGMNETVWVIDYEGNLIDVNNRAVEVLGYSKEDLLSIGLYGIDTALKKEDIKTLVKNMPSDKLQIFETIHTTKDGKTIPVEVYSSLITYHGIKAILSIARDITERKRAEESLKTSEEKFRNLIETMPEGFYVSTPEGYFVDVNPAFVNMLGYDSKEELMKVNIPEELYFSKGDRDVDVFNIDFTSDTEAYRLRKKDGSEIWVVDYGRYIKDDSGNIIFHEGIMRDITESLRAHNAIIEAKDKAEEMSRLKSSFLANMSHEIRTPLNGILGFAQLLQEEVKDDAQLKCVRVIEKSGNRLLETLDLILNFSKLEAEMVSAKYSEVNVSDVIDEVVDSFEAMAMNKNLLIEKKIKYKNLVTKIDDRFLRHVLNNLVKNAIVYTNKGGITVTFDKDDNDIIFKVKDTGIGIAKEYYEVIFEPFRQESEGWGRNFEGTGLGLSITKRFVEMMNGKIEVESEVGAGSTFTVRLPFTETDVTTAVKTRKKESANKAPFAKTPVKKELCILLVENDEDNREFTMAVLDKYYKTDFAEDGYEAIESAKGKVYDIILMDINLGKEIDGIMATQEIRKMKGYKDTPIVALTAYVREGDEEEFLAGGCTHFLGKPFTIKQLLDLIEEIIKQP